MTEQEEFEQPSDDEVIFVLGSIQKLKSKDMIKGGNLEVDEKGMQRYKELEQDGFNLSKQRMKEVVTYIQAMEEVSKDDQS